jgi:hypothetical protein
MSSGYLTQPETEVIRADFVALVIESARCGALNSTPAAAALTVSCHLVAASNEE